VSKLTTSVLSAVFRPSHRPTIILQLVYCAVSNMLFEVGRLDFAVWVCRVATVVMEITQLVLSQFKNFTIIN